MVHIHVLTPGGGRLYLLPSKKFPGRYWCILRGDVMAEEAVIADAVKYVENYLYGGPSEGNAGFLLAEQVAAIVGGKAVLPEVECLPEGVVS